MGPCWRACITLEFYGHRTVLFDKEFPDRIYDLEDIDGEDTIGIGTFPYQCEVNLLFENPEYTKFQKSAEEEYRIRQEKEIQARIEAEKLAAIEAEKKRQAEIEAAERSELARLKQKYE